MSKAKAQYVCKNCGAITNKWVGQCPECNQWNSLTEWVTATGYAGSTSSITKLNDIQIVETTKTSTNYKELDRVLGGGLIPGSVILIGGDPGIGKSTILLQALSSLSKEKNTLYVTGEESLQQVKLRAIRLGQQDIDLQLLAETNLQIILDSTKKIAAEVLVIDSIQTMFCDQVPTAAGTVSQIKECAARLVQFAKQSEVALFMIGHVTKEGALAGPKILEHMVDTVLYFEGDSASKYRIVRAVKNRFGAVNEIGVFAMTGKGLLEVSNPSAIFLSRQHPTPPGSVVMVMWEGSRPMLIEIQALATDSHLANPRRLTVGLDQGRLALLLAVLQRHANISTFNQDVFVNAVGGVRVTETASDLAVAMAIISSLKNRPIANKLVVFGEIGLSGEIRPVQNGQDRIKEAFKLGFTSAIIPTANMPSKPISGMQLFPVDNLTMALQYA